LEAPRLIKLEIYDTHEEVYVPVERLKLYKYATSSWVCSGFEPFPTILGDENIEGEDPAEIGDTLLQNIVGEYLQNLTEPYDTSIQGRLINDTSAIEILDLIQTEDLCTSNTYWVPKFQSCFDCPSTDNVILMGEKVEFEGLSGVDDSFWSVGNIVNGEVFPITVVLKSKPAWVTLLLPDESEDGERAPSLTIEPGEGSFFEYAVTAKDLQPGLATGALSFALLDGGNFLGCDGSGLWFDIEMTILNPPLMFQEGSIKIVGFVMVAIVSCMALIFALWVYQRREKSAVKTMQPAFLLTICFGVFIAAFSILTRSLQGQGNSERGNDMGCMATAWLLSMGFIVVMSALLAKLWRINKVIDGARAFRRTTISAGSAAKNFSILFVLNFILMLVWTLVDPMQYDIHVAEGQSWKLYGTCNNMGAAGWTFLGLTVGINFCVLLWALYEAYKARNLGDSYSESQGLSLAIFSWVQLLVVVVPVLFLIEADNVSPRYFLEVSLIFACCISMLLFIFVPLIMNVGRSERRLIERPAGGFGKFRFMSAPEFMLRSIRSLRNIQSTDPTPPPRLPQERHISAPPSVAVQNEKKKDGFESLETVPMSMHDSHGSS
jgi:hypothetical protein